jgi:hypothetical protein
MSREPSDNRGSTRRNFLGTGLALTATSLIAGSAAPGNSGAGTIVGRAAPPVGAAALVAGIKR